MDSLDCIYGGRAKRGRHCRWEVQTSRQFMTDAFAAAPRPKVPIFRTAYDGYRLGIGAIFGNFAMFRYFVYGSVLWISLIGYEFYDSFSSTTAVMRGGAGRPII